ncbi:MAG: hypothetical protein AB7T20_05260 [Steroidobacteraceae bacterium]
MNAVKPNAIGGELLARLPLTPDAYPQAVDLVRGRVLVVRLDANGYRAASFLDDRILGPATQGAWLVFPGVAEAARQVTSPRPLHYIFHTGHVGSTLVSRLLDETGVLLSLREPLPLRTIADAHDALGKPESLQSESQFVALLDTMLCLWSRGYDWTRAVVVKATSTAGRAAAPLLAARPESRAIYLNLRAEPYLATLLGGPNSATDLRGHGPGRILRLQARCRNPIQPLHRLSPGELAALGWLVETMALADAVRLHPGRVLDIDFGELLDDIPAGMERIVSHLGLPRDPRYLAGIGRSPVLQRYSKAPELPFPPGERAARLEESRRLHRDEITSGRTWLGALARTEEAVADVLSAAGGP